MGRKAGMLAAVVLAALAAQAQAGSAAGHASAATSNASAPAGAEAGNAGVPTGEDDWLSLPLLPAASGYTFAAADGTPMRWQRVAPAIVAWSVDQRAADGPIAFAGVPATMSGQFESQDCESVGCRLYRSDRSGDDLQELAGQGGGYGIMDVGISRDGGTVAAISINTNPETDIQGRLLAWRDGQLAVRGVRKQAFAIEGLDEGFAAIAGSKVYEGGTAGWTGWRPGPSCAFYDIAITGERILLAGWSGTYAGRFRSRRNAGKGVRRPAVRRIGPASDAVWSSGDGKTLAISPIASSAELLLSTDGGKTWRAQRLIDGVGTDTCANTATNDANACSDDVPDARLDMHVIAGGGADDLWAFGGRADIPGGRAYRYAGADRWERVPFPADIWWASDAVIAERGRPLVATMEGIYRAVPRG